MKQIEKIEFKLSDSHELSGYVNRIIEKINELTQRVNVLNSEIDALENENIKKEGL